ncbi:hypothetical protein, partial [Ligilactobacillus ruminis]
DCSFNLHLMVMVCCNRFTSLSSYINYIISMCENPRKGKGKKEAPRVLERGLSCPLFAARDGGQFSSFTPYNTTF